jgi:hypothetical protein
LPSEEETILLDSDTIPTPNEKDNLALCRIKFNVRSSIFPTADPHEVIQGWNYLSQYMQLDKASRLERMTEIFMIEYLNKLRTIPPNMFCHAEPDVIDCARLTYWYFCA